MQSDMGIRVALRIAWGRIKAKMKMMTRHKVMSLFPQKKMNLAKKITNE